ncbi:DUF305 domain-containing protein [Nocardioides sp. LMS-CY]|uniref:DUF305 domain-containing protein n=1 Tax=Nocardioides sp. (strain LMS-CY) TaxID=2840457 RepID=UPI001C0018C8|nr:DUF305 domain-containing protein [Nocardioides sp. LMS-CY]QWF23713.1 DUF305 domain-containing protein [Nocardioides sp. LMS-CY]
MPLHTRTHARTGTRRLRRTATALALTAALGVSLAACGDDADTADGPSGTRTATNGDVFNTADVSFATEMIQHHAQALSMVDLADGRPLDPEVQQLTEDIRAAQGPEIETMSDWLTAWDQEIPETMRDHSNAGHDMGGDMSDRMDGMDSDMPGMMSPDEMDELQDASNAAFQDLWLTMMIEHHQGAIEMARTEQEDGAFDEAVTLAETIASAQQQEIETMEGLLG